MERVGVLDLSFDADFENPALRRTTMIIGGIPSPKHYYCASIFGQKEGQACFPDFVKGNQLHWLPVPSLLRRSQCIAWNCFFMRILRTIMFWKKQMDIDKAQVFLSFFWCIFCGFAKHIKIYFSLNFYYF